MSSYDDNAYDTNSYSTSHWDMVKKFVDDAWTASVSFTLSVATGLRMALGAKE